jgi:hypothetical protein
MSSLKLNSTEGTYTFLNEERKIDIQSLFRSNTISLEQKVAWFKELQLQLGIPKSVLNKVVGGKNRGLNPFLLASMGATSKKRKQKQTMSVSTKKRKPNMDPLKVLLTKYKVDGKEISTMARAIARHQLKFGKADISTLNKFKKFLVDCSQTTQQQFNALKQRSKGKMVEEQKSE